ncbi:uncharacterized protein PG998_004543 [Apiospora kogelbergensis]|uniref:uncharacterized protein n=1 Tax=Apiospora kogelbergensis TaxID=1337665 RepID=UPI00312F8200
MAMRTKLSGRRTQTFFVVKSNDVGNIWTCHEECIWATSSVEKGDALANAFENSKNVVLFFSANKSGASQGYASGASWLLRERLSSKVPARRPISEGADPVPWGVQRAVPGRGQRWERIILKTTKWADLDEQVGDGVDSSSNNLNPVENERGWPRVTTAGCLQAGAEAYRIYGFC